MVLSVTDTVYYYFCYDCFPHYIKSIEKCQLKQVNFSSIVYKTCCPTFDFFPLFISNCTAPLFSSLVIVGISRKQGELSKPTNKTDFEVVCLF